MTTSTNVPIGTARPASRQAPRRYPSCIRCGNEPMVEMVAKVPLTAHDLEWHCGMCGTYWTPNYVAEPIGAPKSLPKSLQTKLTRAQALALMTETWIGYPEIRRRVGVDRDPVTPIWELVRLGKIERQETTHGPLFRKASS